MVCYVSEPVFIADLRVTAEDHGMFCVPAGVHSRPQGQGRGPWYVMCPSRCSSPTSGARQRTMVCYVSQPVFITDPMGTAEDHGMLCVRAGVHRRPQGHRRGPWYVIYPTPQRLIRDDILRFN
ncbi:hypothetical protein DPMN_030800 [Dreissena polymorpha]|uniref:Uncharacterized protein n=1 Tax=Dreissena polymorpha TaxID=45954 RepID=A0A9D4LZQ0_DREPO|nr:hypothetical protein DPMN_030800 [Dreissena polymorpha]